MGTFETLKSAYCELIEHFQQRGANTVNNEHYIFLYRHAREIASTARDIMSIYVHGAKTWIILREPVNPVLVLVNICRPKPGWILNCLGC